MRGDQALAVGLVDGDRFLDEHVQAGLERGDAGVGVIIVRRRDEHRVDQSGRDQLAVGGEAGDAGELCQPRGIAVGDRGEAQARDFPFENAPRMDLSP